MKIQYCSDLHLEFPENKEFLKTHPLVPAGDILILAGDIVPFHLMEEHADFFNYLADHFETAYWVPRNHEYYHGDLEGWSGELNQPVRSNIFLVNNQVISHQGLKFIFSTLWTRISQGNSWIIRKNLSDFHYINNYGTWLMPDHYNKLHSQCLEFLTNELHKAHDGQTVVVTHHVPTFFNYPEKYKGDVLNEAFAVELSELITDHGPDYWIYGHHHHNIPDFSIEKTILSTNQLGYLQHNEKLGFIDRKIININS